MGLCQSLDCWSSCHSIAEVDPLVIYDHAQTVEWSFQGSQERPQEDYRAMWKKGLQDPPFFFLSEKRIFWSSLVFPSLPYGKRREALVVLKLNACVVLKYIIRNDKTTNNQMEKDW